MSHDKQPVPVRGSFHLSDGIAAFIESGVSIILAVVGDDGRARAGRALAARVLAGGAVRVMYPTEGNGAILAAARAGGPVAVTFSAPVSHRTIQLKAMSCRAERLGRDDRDSLGRQMDAFADVLRSIGFAPAFVQSFCDNRSQSVSVFSFVPQAGYEQTPGPGAGREL